MVIIMDFSKFDKAIDVEGLKADVASAQDNSSGGNYREVPKGEYEVSITKLELTASKKGDPMVTIWFRIVSGDYENSLIFMNQVITQGFQIHIVKVLLCFLQRNSFFSCIGHRPSKSFSSFSE